MLDTSRTAGNYEKTLESHKGAARSTSSCFRQPSLCAKIFDPGASLSYEGLMLCPHYKKARRFLEQSLVQRELGVYLFSMDTILLLESIVHCYSYTRRTHLHTGRKDYPSTSFHHIEAPIHSWCVAAVSPTFMKSETSFGKDKIDS